MECHNVTSSNLVRRRCSRLPRRACWRSACAGGSCRERATAMVTTAARRLHEDPLFDRLLDVDPELLLPYVTVRLGGMQRIAIAGLAAELAAGRGDGSVRDGDPETLARGIELIARGFVLARDPELDAWAELARAVDGYLRP